MHAIPLENIASVVHNANGERGIALLSTIDGYDVSLEKQAVRSIELIDQH